MWALAYRAILAFRGELIYRLNLFPTSVRLLSTTNIEWTKLKGDTLEFK